jgi:hypothetical protein
MFINEKDVEKAGANGIGDHDLLSLEALGFVLSATAGHKTLRGNVQISFGAAGCFCWSPARRTFVYQVPCNNCQGTFRVRSLSGQPTKGQANKNRPQAKAGSRRKDR